MKVHWKKLNRLGSLREEWLLLAPTIIRESIFHSMVCHLAKIRPTNDGRYELSLRPNNYCSIWNVTTFQQRRYNTIEEAKNFAESFLEWNAIDKLDLRGTMVI